MSGRDDPAGGVSGGLTWLDDAVLVPEPFAVLDRAGALHHGVMPARLPDLAETPMVAASLIPLAVGASVPLGVFLGAQLSAALLGVRSHGAASGGPELIGAALTPPQLDAMTMLGLLGRYVPISGPTRVARLGIAPVERGLSRLDRSAIETLRFSAEPFEAVKGVAILAPPALARFDRSNDAGLRLWLRARGVALLDLDQLKLDRQPLGLLDLIALLAACRVVVIDDAMQAPLLGFCDPGAVVIELGVEGWTQPAIAAATRLFALERRTVLTPAPRYPIKSPLPIGASRMLSIEADLGALDAALAGLITVANA